jgi:L-asparaginase II
MNAKLRGFLKQLRRVAPIILAVTVPGGKGVQIASVIERGMSAAEQIKGADGAAKKAHVLSLVAVAVDAENMRKGKRLNKLAVIQTASAAIDTVVGVVNVASAARRYD